MGLCSRNDSRYISLTTANKFSIGNLEENEIFVGKIKDWFESALNGIETIYAKVMRSEKVETKELCIDGVCINKDQLQQILQNQNININSNGSSSEIIPDPEPISESNIENKVVQEETEIQIINDPEPESTPEPESNKELEVVLGKERRKVLRFFLLFLSFYLSIYIIHLFLILVLLLVLQQPLFLIYA